MYWGETYYRKNLYISAFVKLFRRFIRFISREASIEKWEDEYEQIFFILKIVSKEICRKYNFVLSVFIIGSSYFNGIICTK